MEGPIWWTAIDQYADRMRISGEQREDLHYYIAEMDKVFLAHRAKEIKKDSNKSGKGNKARAGKKSLTRPSNG